MNQAHSQNFSPLALKMAEQDFKNRFWNLSENVLVRNSKTTGPIPNLSPDYEMAARALHNTPLTCPNRPKFDAVASNGVTMRKNDDFGAS